MSPLRTLAPLAVFGIATLALAAVYLGGSYLWERR